MIPTAASQPRPSEAPRPSRVRRPTATAPFGSSRRESHDASVFYSRFVPPELSADADVAQPAAVDVVYRADARDMRQVATGSVALVVTSPPYFAGKEYETSLGRNGVPATYFDYLTLLRDVFAECKRVLEPGGRIAVNVANLGRRPYRSLAGDVTAILQDLGLLLRGEVVWWKGRAAGGSCAWGSFQRPANPVLRDVTERIVIASKGRFDRALTPAVRQRLGLPSTATIWRDEFLEATTDLWEIPPESAIRIGHPAPFPVELPQRLIELYTYRGDVVLDPFLGSGTTAVAALSRGRHYIGFDTDPNYVERAKQRLADAAVGPGPAPPVQLPAVPEPRHPTTTPVDPVAEAVRQGRQATDVAHALLGACGFRDIRAEVKVPASGATVSFAAADATGGRWAVEVVGAFTAARGGLRRMDALWRTLGKASAIHHSHPEVAFVVLTTDLPGPSGAGASALRVVRGPGRPVFDVVELLDPVGRQRLARYALEGHGRRLAPPLPLR